MESWSRFDAFSTGFVVIGTSPDSFKNLITVFAYSRMIVLMLVELSPAAENLPTFKNLTLICFVSGLR